jgi:hypothetical protein
VGRYKIKVAGNILDSDTEKHGTGNMQLAKAALTIKYVSAKKLVFYKWYSFLF